MTLPLAPRSSGLATWVAALKKSVNVAALIVSSLATRSAIDEAAL